MLRAHPTIGVIGFGSIGARHAANAKALGCDVGVYDAEWMKAQGSPYWPAPSIESFLQWGVDALLICTPASTHAAVARELLALNYTGPLFVEKPLALSVDECDVFRHWPSPITMVGYMLRFHPHAKTLRRVIAPDPGWIDCRLHCHMDAWPGSSYGEPLFECSHEIDLALWCGCGDLVSATRDVTADVLTFERGRVVIDPCQSKYFREWSGTGELYGYQWCFDTPEALGDQMYRDELTHFLACVEQHFPTITPFEDGIRVVQVCEQAMRLAKETV